MHRHVAPLHAGSLLNRADISEHLYELLKQPATDLRMRHLTTAEADGEFDLIAGFQKLRSLTPLGLQIVSADLRLNAQLLQIDDVLITARVSLLAALLIPESPIVHEPANRGNGIWRNFDKINPALPCHLERFAGLENPNLLAFFVDDTDLANPDPLINPCLYWS